MPASSGRTPPVAVAIGGAKISPMPTPASTIAGSTWPAQLKALAERS